MMRILNLIGFAAFLSAGAILAGCAAAEESEAPRHPIQMSAAERDSEARKIVENHMANFAAAFRDRDIEKFKKMLTPERQKRLTAATFQEILNTAAQEQGELRQMELATVLDQIVYQSYVWKLTYEKKDSEGKPVRRDFLYYVRIGKIGDGQYSISSSGFCL